MTLLGPPKVKVTLRVEQAVYDAAKAHAAQQSRPVAVVLADAAKQRLLPEYQEPRDDALRRAVDRTHHQLRRAERKLALDLHLLKEMLGLHVRTDLNHTPAIPESERDAASLSGRIRFERYLDLLARNARPGSSILAPPDVPPPEIAAPEVMESPPPEHSEDPPPEPQRLLATDAEPTGTPPWNDLEDGLLQPIGTLFTQDGTDESPTDRHA